MAFRATDDSSDILKDFEHLLFVEMEDAGVTSYRGWKRELLVEEIVSASEKKLLLCTLCDGMLRNACCFQRNQNKQARCDKCLPANFRIYGRNIVDLIRSVVDERMIYCPFLNEDCKWTGPTLEIQPHLKDCQYFTLPCPLGCFESVLYPHIIKRIPRKSLPDHLSNTCPMRLIPCEYCLKGIRASSVNIHITFCNEYPVTCINNCKNNTIDGATFSTCRRLIEYHLKFDCPLQEVLCPYSKYGCDVEIARQYLQQHKMDFMGKHLNLVESRFNDIKLVGGIEWKILFVNNRWNKNKEVYSTPFYSCGYKIKFCVEFDENQLGVYFSLLKGEYDDELKWPLKGRVTITLVNQLNVSHGDITRSILSEDDPDNFEKPESVPNYLGFQEILSREDSNSFGYSYITGVMEADIRINWIEARLAYSLKHFSSDLNSQISLPKNRIILTGFLRRSSRRALSISSSSHGDIFLSFSTAPKDMVISQYYIKYPHINTVQSNQVSESLISADVTLPITIQDIDWLILNLFISKLLDSDKHRLVLTLKTVFDISRSFRHRSSGEFSLPYIIIPKQFHAYTSNLSSLFEDLASCWLTRISKAIVSPQENELFCVLIILLHHLKISKSWIVKKIDDLYISIEQVLFESEDLLVYLLPLEKWMILCLDALPDSRREYIQPICKLLYLIWDQCSFYQIQSNFIHLLSSVIIVITEIVRERLPEDLFSNPIKSIEEIESVLLLCYTFQGSYTDAKTDADHCLDKLRDNNLLEFNALPEALRTKYELDKVSKPLPCVWPNRKDQIYQRFSKIVNRLRDLLEIAKTIYDFEDIRVIIQNGNDFSATFDEHLEDILSKFLSILKPILRIESSLFDVGDNDKFEGIFFAFRNEIKKLEYRIINILKPYLTSNCDPLNLRRMQLFGRFVNRPMIRTSLIEFLVQLIDSLGQHIEQVHSLVSNYETFPGFHHFAPAQISKYLYLRSLVERLDTPYRLVTQISHTLFDLSASGYVSNEYLILRNKLEQLLNSFTFIDPELSDDFSLLLHKPVLVASGKSHTLIPSLQPDVVHLIYIAKYINKLGFSPSLIPHSLRILLEQYSNLELYSQLPKLFFTVHRFNKIWSNRNSPVHHLFSERINDCKQLVERGLTEVTWNSFVLKDFLQQMVTYVFTSIDPTLNQTEHGVTSIKNVIHSWCIQPSNLFSSTPYPPARPLTELSQRIKAGSHDYERIIVSSRDKIHQILNRISTSFSINMHCTQWKQFMQYIDQLLYRGITSQTSKSYSAIQYYLAPLSGGPENAHSIHGLFSINFRVAGDNLSFHPSPYPEGQAPSLVEQLKSWVMGVYTRNASLHPFSHPKGAFIESLKNEMFFSNLITDFDYILLDDLNNCHTVLQKFSQFSFLWMNDCNSYFRNFISPRTDTSPITQEKEFAILDTSHSDESSLNTIRINEFAFLYPNLHSRTQGLSSRSALPLFEDFEREICVYYSLKQELLRIPQYLNIGFIVIDARGIRSFLLSLCANWLFTFCDYLQDKVILVLEDMNFLFEKIEPEVSKIGIETADLPQLMKSMRIFYTMRNRQSDIEHKFSTLQRANSILEKFEFTLRQDIHDFYVSTPQKLDHLNAVFGMAKQRIRPYIATHKKEIIEKLHSFQQELTAISNQFYRSYLFNSDCPTKDARELLDEYVQKFSDLKDKSKDVCELQSFLETQFVNFSSLQKLLDTFITIRRVWLLVEEVTHSTKHMKRDMWKKQAPEEIQQKIQELRDKVDKIPQEGSQWDITLSIRDYLDELKSTVPLLTLIQSPSIRESHWKLILKLSPKPRVGSATITDASILTKLSFGKLIDLGLHLCLPQIEAIVEKSRTEITSETIINTFRTVWDGYLLTFEDYIRSIPQPISGFASSVSSSHSSNENLAQSSGGIIRRHSKGFISSRMSGINTDGLDTLVTEAIPKLTNVLEIFKTLDVHIDELETVMNSTESILFQEDLKPWQHKFQRIKTVLKLLVEVQDNWMQADKFFSWSDVRQNLTQEAIGFIVVDKQWRILMKEVQSDPHVMRTCCKEGRLRFLQELNRTVGQTRVAIYKYYENFKSLYPRFYFISSYYIHAFISNYTNVKVLSKHIHMIFPGVHELAISNTDVKDKYIITGVIATNGGIVQLNSSLIPDNFEKVTGLLNSFSATLHDTLKDYFASSIEKISNETPFDRLDINNIAYFLLKELTKAKSSEIYLLIARVLFCTILQRLVTMDDITQLKCALSGFQKLLILLNRYLHSGNIDSLELMQKDDVVLDEWEQDTLEESSSQHEILTMTTYLLVQNFIITIFYFKGLTESLISLNNVTKLEASIEWQSSIKHLLPKDDTTTCNFSIHCLSVPYVFEFQGDHKELVLFPNTERCFSHLLQSLTTNFGGLLVGRQGSGKMSTIRQFAYLLGRPLFEYSCTSHTLVDYLKDFIYGAYNSRSLVCFQCIDNIQAPKMSIFIETIRALFSGHMSSKIGFPIVQPYTPFDINHGAVMATAQCMTLTRSPDFIFVNVFKPYFLSPDVSVISEVLLYTSGFQNAHEIALRLNKFYEMYNILVNTSTSKSLAYFSIFKLRHLLIIASEKLVNEFTDPVSQIRRYSHSLPLETQESEFESGDEQISNPRPMSEISHRETSIDVSYKDEEEEIRYQEFEIICSSLIEYLPSLTCFLHPSQINKLQHVIQSLFYEDYNKDRDLTIDLISSSQHQFSAQNPALLRVLKYGMLEPDEYFVSKVGELWKSLKLHFMVLLLGPSSSGKSSALSVCSGLFKDIGNSAYVHSIFPQSLPRDHLFGGIQLEEKTWTKSLLDHFFDNCVILTEKIKNPKHHWFHIDGSLDKFYCDVLATFNFENYAITLMTKHKMTFRPNVRIILESDNADFLTPSLIAKLGIISFPSIISWNTILHSWLDKQLENESFQWQSIFDTYLPVIMTCLFRNSPESDEITLKKLSCSTKKNLLKTELKFVVQLNQVCVISSLVALLDSLILTYPKPSKIFKEVLFNFAAVWAIGGCLDQNSRIFFSTIWQELFQGPYTFPKGSNIWSFVPNFDSQSLAVPRLGNFTCSKENLFTQMPFITDPETETIVCLFDYLSTNTIPILISGDVGSGKSLLTDHLSKRLESSYFDQKYSKKFKCNSRSSSQDLWEVLQTELVWSATKSLYVPRGNRKLHMLVEDIHLVDVSDRTTNSVTEMLRWISYVNELFDFNTYSWKDIQHVNFIVTCNSKLTNLRSRFTSHFFIHHYQYATFNSQVSIFSKLIRCFFNGELLDSKRSNNPSTNQSFIQSIVSLTVEMQISLKSMFVGTQERSLYLFTLSDISNLFRSLCLILEPNCPIRDFLQLWNHEVYWLYEHKLVNCNDTLLFRQLKTRLIHKYFDSSVLKNYLNQPVERYSFIENVLEHIPLPPWVLSEYKINSDEEKLPNLLNQPTVKQAANKLIVTPFRLDMLNRISLHLFSPPDYSNLIIIGESEIASTLSLLASLFNFTFERISHFLASHSEEIKGTEDHCIYLKSSAYDLGVFDHFMRDIYTRAGINMENIILLVQYKELKSKQFFFRILEFLEDCQISPLFSLEQRGNIVNGLRTHISKLSQVFSESLAWKIFLSNVTKNLRIVINVKEIDINFYQLIHSVPSLFNRLKCIVCPKLDHTQLTKVCEQAMKQHYPKHTVLKPRIHDLIVELLPTLFTDLCKNLNYNYSYIPGNNSFNKFAVTFSINFGIIYGRILSQQKIIQCALSILASIQKTKDNFELEYPNREFVYKDKKASCSDFIKLIGQLELNISQTLTSLQRLEQNIEFLDKTHPKIDDALQLAILESKNKIEMIVKATNKFNNHDIEWLRANSKEPELSHLLTVFISLFKSGTDTQPLNRTIRRLLSNSERFLSQIVDFHSNTDELSEDTLESIYEVLQQDIVSGNTVTPDSELHDLIDKISSWLRAIANYYEVILHKVNPLKDRIECNLESLVKFNSLTDSLRTKIRSFSDSKRNLDQSFYHSSLSLTEYIDSYEKQSVDLQSISSLIEDLGTIPEKWRAYAQMSDEEVTSLITASAISYGYLCILSSFPIQDQIHILLHVWPKSLEKLSLKTNWKEALNFRMNNIVGFDCIPGIMPYKSQTSSNYFQILNSICYFIFHNSVNDHLTPLKSISFAISKEYLNESSSSWVSISSSSPYKLSEFTNRQNTTEIDLACSDPHLYDTLRDSILKGNSLIINHLDTIKDPVLYPLLEFASVFKENRDTKNPIQLAGRTLVANKHLSLVFSMNTPSFCYPSVYSSKTLHLNMLPSHTLCYEVCLHKLLTNHYLSKSWLDLFAFVVSKETLFESVQHELAQLLAKLFRCDVNTGVSYLPQDTEIPQIAYKHTQELVTLWNLRPYVQTVREYTEKSFHSVYTQICHIPDTLGNLACSLSCIQEMHVYYYLNVNWLYPLVEELFLDYDLDKIQPSNIARKPSITLSDYLKGILDASQQEDLIKEFCTNLNWPDNVQVNQEKLSVLSGNVNVILNKLNRSFVTKAVQLYMPYLTRHDQFTWLLLSALIVNVYGVADDYSSILIYSIIRILSNSPLLPKGSFTKISKPDWIEDSKWDSILKSPLNDNCIKTLYNSFTDQQTEWSAWISNSMPSYKNMPIPISMDGQCSSDSILCVEALIVLHLFFPINNEEVFRDFITDNLQCDFLSTRTFPLSNLLNINDSNPNPSKLNIFYFVMEKECKFAISKSLTLQYELASLYTTQGIEVKSFSHLDLSTSLPNFDDFSSAHLLLFKEFHLVKKGNRESFFSKLFSMSHKPINIVLYGEWCDDLSESLPEVISIFPIENIEFGLFSHISYTEYIYPSIYHVFECVYDSLPMETKLKILSHPMEHTCYLVILFHCSLITKRNCLRCSIANLSIDLLITSLEKVLTLKTNEGSTQSLQEQEIFTIISSVYSINNEPGIRKYGIFAEQVLGVPHEVINQFKRRELYISILPTPSYFFIISDLLSVKLSISSEMSQPLPRTTLPLRCFPDVQFLPFNITNLLFILDRTIQQLTQFPVDLNLVFETNSPLFHYVIANELKDVHALLLDISEKCLSLQNYLKTGVLFIPKDLILIGESLSKQAVPNEWDEMYNQIGTKSEFFLWLKQFIEHFCQLRKWVVSPLQDSSALNLSFFRRTSLLLDSLHKESQFLDSYSDPIISLWLPNDNFNVPVKRGFILNFKANINFVTNDITIDNLESKTNKVYSLLSIPGHVYTSQCLQNGEDEIFILKLNSNSLCSIHCPSYLLAGLASS
ncbi:Dynein heavy chain 17, axonemal [Oopsacas minuta]|uniref:Dynein heavy chain 17, axonemal n=1 Tax=Oopsacas minuta TaxID=111878 RepID=A0AAV7K3P6_9METZ|nr:Dynein heavy chain 17, axonemal [Oopsacas minuta]